MKRSMLWGACFLIALGGLQALPPREEIPYGIGSWKAELYGNHRVVIRVREAADAVWAHIPWRRRDAHPEQKDAVLVDARRGQRVRNLIRVNITRESGDFLFEPVSGPGEYYLYYLPYRMTGRSNYPTVTYPVPEETADKAWLEKVGWRDGTVSARPPGFPETEVASIQSISPLDSFNPMEVIATEQETRALLEEYPFSPFLLFPEGRFFPIRMREALPLRWIRTGPGIAFEGTACRGEFYAYQIGLYACRQDLSRVKVRFRPLEHLQSGAVIPAEASRCFNTGGVDWTGKSFRKDCSVPHGEVQALWCGIQVPLDIPPGDYKGEVEVAPEGLAPDRVTLFLHVKEDRLEDAGDSDPWRHTRLRWLDSTIALDEEVVAPFLPLEVEGNRVRCLGREVTLAGNGLPADIRSFFAPEMTFIGKTGKPVLASPIRLVVEDAGGRILRWSGDSLRFGKQAPGAVQWKARGPAGPMGVSLEARMEADGFLDFRLTLTAEQKTEVRDVRLEIPLRRDTARFMMGMGYKGGLRPDSYSWKWDPERNQDSVWIGDVNAGLQCSFRDERYSRPLNTNFYRLKPLVMPLSWCNGGRGGCDFSPAEEDAFLVRASSGPRTVREGERLSYYFSLLITPFKVLDTGAHWHNRYYHRYEPVEKISAAGANVINVHHATPVNPYINYPFLRPLEMKQYVDRAHALDMKVKIYYTVRELTNRAPELFALRSLGHEIFAPGPGGGFSWLQEHLVSDYIPGWFVPRLKDAAIINSGQSRWHNYYLEGLNWLMKHVGIDGLYIDDVAFDRTVMKRLRKILDRSKEGCLIDLHSANQYNPRDGFASSANLYLEHFPYINRLWFGEYFDYDSPPDYWLVEVSGIPFGLMGEMLQDGGNPWRGMLYGMTARLPWSGNPAPLWAFWDALGIQEARMIGYWVPGNPVSTDHPLIPVTVYAKKDKALISLASWEEEDTSCRLRIDWKKLGMNPEKSRLEAPAVEGFQPAASFRIGESIPVKKGRGWLLVLSKESPPKIPERDGGEPLPGREGGR